MDIIMKAKTTIMAYCMKAIISPTRMCTWATSCAPTQRMPTIAAFITSIMKGMTTTKTRLTNRVRRVRVRFSTSKREASWSSRLKARTTIMPVRFSRTTRFTRSTCS